MLTYCCSARWGFIHGIRSWRTREGLNVRNTWCSLYFVQLQSGIFIYIISFIDVHLLVFWPHRSISGRTNTFLLSFVSLNFHCDMSFRTGLCYSSLRLCCTHWAWTGSVVRNDRKTIEIETALCFAVLFVLFVCLFVYLSIYLFVSVFVCFFGAIIPLKHNAVSWLAFWLVQECFSILWLLGRESTLFQIFGHVKKIESR